MKDTWSDRELEDKDSFPLRQIVVLAICRLAEPIAYTSAMSYTYVMVQDLKGDDSTSFFAGAIVSAFSIAEACTAVFWGSLSDRYGRKPIIVIGLIGTILSCFLVGFAKHYWVAFLGRFLGGLLNGNIAVIQTMVAEIITNPKHEPLAYAMHPLMWNIGSVLGSALGGYTAQPARFYPQYFAEDGIFGKYPYLLPNLVCVGIIGIAAIQAIVLLKETRTTSPRTSRQSSISSAKAIDERTPLRAEKWRSRARIVTNVRPGTPVFAAGGLPSPIDPSLDVRRSSFGTIRSVDWKSAVQTQIEPFPVFDEPPSNDHAPPPTPFTKEVIAWIIASVLMCSHLLMFTSTLPLYVIDPPSATHGLDLRGGLGLTIHEVADYLAVNSVWSIFVQIAIFPVLMTKAGIWNCIVLSTILCPLVDVVMPFISLLSWTQIALHIAFSARILFYIMSYPGQLIMLKNAAPSADSLGRINGMAVSAASVGRTFSPLVIGLVYDGFGSAAAWLSCAVVSTTSILQFCFLHKPRNKEHDILRRASINTLRN